MSEFFQTESFKVKILNEGTPLDQKKYQFKNLKLVSDINRFPYGELTLTVNQWEQVLDHKEYHLILEIYNQEVLEFDFAILKRDVGDREVKFLGYLGSVENCILLGSEFLGKDSEEALNKLGFIQKCKDSPKISGEFFRINETRVSAAMRILRGIQKDHPFIIDDSSFEYIDLDTDDYENHLETQSLKIKFDTIPDTLLEKEIIEKNVDTTFVPGSTWVGDPSYYKATVRHINNRYRVMSSYPDDIPGIDYIATLLHNYKYKDGYSVSTAWTIPAYMKYKIGTRVSFPISDEKNKNFVITGKEVNFGQGLINTILLISTELERLNPSGGFGNVQL